MIVQTRVLISCITNPMLCARGARQQSCRGAAVQVVNDVVTIRAQLAGDPARAAVLLRSSVMIVIDVWKPIEHRRDPIFQQNVDGACGRNRLSANSDGVVSTVSPIERKPHHQNALDRLPVPARGRERLRPHVFAAQAVHRQGAHLRRRFNYFAQTVQPFGRSIGFSIRSQSSLRQ